MKVCPICQERHDDSTACEVDLTSQSLESRKDEPQVPGFRLDHLLTTSHHAETYRSRDVASGRKCLIKVVAADADSAKQAIREARIAANLFHPSIANFYDSGRLDDGRCFFVFEDVEGRSLREIIDNDGTPDLLDTIEDDPLLPARSRQFRQFLDELEHGILPRRFVMRTNSPGVIV